MFDLLQIDTLQKVANALPPVPEKISLWSLLEKGGWIMYPLYILLVIAIFVFFLKDYWLSGKHRVLMVIS